ncbi:MAG TPA: hypothetical protein VMT11_00750 [Myxococcaceae bacterium]|nr:hypothetical protein [Myxococcaceae bacterium]
MRTESDGWRWVQKVFMALVCVTGLVTLATAGVHPARQAVTPSFAGWVPPSMHEAEAGVDVGPGSDEALLVSAPSGQ